MFGIIFGAFIGLIAAAAYVAYTTYNENEKVARSLRRGYGESEKESYTPKKPSKSLAIVLFLIPLLVFTLLSSMTRVGTGEIAVMTRFGKVTGQELGEGLHFVNPVDSATKYDVKVLKEEADAAAASKDLQDVSGRLVVNYRLEAGKVSEIHRTVGPLYKEKLIDPAIQEVFKGSTAKYDATQLITDRSGVKAVTYEALRDRLAGYGIIVQDLSITNFGFSPEFTKAIEAKQVAQQQAQQAVFLAEKATQEAAAEIERAKGSAEAQRLQQETLTPLLIQKQFLEKWNGEMPKVTGGQNILDISSLIQ